MKNIIDEKELEISVIEEYSITASDGKLYKKIDINIYA
ncbi:MAG: hypothetical protein P857_818 [Candidatus Xenolissoclinum pacificiensis L6]|uniref:Uncharacterized protein n=1 Tax=Candidatus Xenolissoclinum pacificiensis L6 TaxID=1401685 RepID=W2V2I0_9RICK|nr:MAG: hypothetical protein P857_818 [Candidatus Xenolissoclinum pacificiensis L6]